MQVLQQQAEPGAVKEMGGEKDQKENQQTEKRKRCKDRMMRLGLEPRRIAPPSIQIPFHIIVVS